MDWKKKKNVFLCAMVEISVGKTDLKKKKEKLEMIYLKKV